MPPDCRRSRALWKSFSPFLDRVLTINTACLFCRMMPASSCVLFISSSRTTDCLHQEKRAMTVSIGLFSKKCNVYDRPCAILLVLVEVPAEPGITHTTPPPTTRPAPRTARRRYHRPKPGTKTNTHVNPQEELLPLPSSRSPGILTGG